MTNLPLVNKEILPATSSNPSHLNSILNPTKSSVSLSTLSNLSSTSFASSIRDDTDNNSNTIQNIIAVSNNGVIKGKNTNNSDNSKYTNNSDNSKNTNNSDNSENINNTNDNNRISNSRNINNCDISNKNNITNNNKNNNTIANSNESIGKQSEGEDNEDHDNEDYEDSSISPGQTSTTVPPRKRSKVSRACDECRRKKIKCNAILDLSSNSVTKVCSSCEKNNESCTFTRIPLKRGPTKGYNKKSTNTSSSIETTQKRKVSRSRANSNVSTTKNDHFESENDLNSTNYLPIQPARQQQFILPPLNSIPFTNKQNDLTNIPPQRQQHPTQQQQQQQHHQSHPQEFHRPQVQESQQSQHPQNQQHSQQYQNHHHSHQQKQGIFWKVPTEMPMLSPDVKTNGRKSSLDSRHSSISSSSSVASASNRMLLSSSGYANNNNSKGSISGFENSDSEDDFFMNNSRISKSNIQVPFNLQERSPRLSFASENSDNRANFLSNPPALANSIIQNSLKFKNTEMRENLDSLIDYYYVNLYPQYPLLPSSSIIKMSVSSLINNADFVLIIDSFYTALKSIHDIHLETDKISAYFLDIAKSFESITSMFLSKSFVYSSIPAKVILTSTLVLLNYGIVLSGFDYSLGFGISFSYFKDWFIFKEGYDSPCFSNLIQLVILDSLYTLYFGVPRSSTVCFAIDLDFIDNFLKELKFSDNVEVEWLSIGLHLVILNNSLQDLDTLDKLGTIIVTGTNFKFMLIIKLYYELFVYCRKLNIQTLITEFTTTSSSNDGNLNDFLNNKFNSIELEISKMTKKITNLIDEQLDDLEISKPNVLVSLILIKCIHISINLKIFLKSIMHLNEILDFSPNGSRRPSTFNPNSMNRSRSSSINSLNSVNSITTSSTMMYSNTSTFSKFSDHNNRLMKIIENIDSNTNRCQNLNQINKNCNELIKKLINSEPIQINVPRTNSFDTGIEYSVVLQNWVRLINSFFSNEITKEGVNGWCYM